MAEHEQSIHLYVGDQAMQGHRAAADAGVYNVSDTVRPIFRYIGGATQDTHWTLPAPIVNLEWGIEHIIPQQFDAVTLNWLAGFGSAKLKICIAGTEPNDLLPGGSLRTQLDAAMTRAAIDPMFFLSGDTSFLLNGATSVVASGSTTTVPDVERPDLWEEVGLHLRCTTTFISSAARQDALLTFTGAASNNAIRLALSAGATRLEVDVAGTTYSSPTFAHIAETLNVVVSFRDRTAYVYDSSGNELARVTVAGDWTGAVGADAVFGLFDGTAFAPQELPKPAAPRLDAIFFAMWNDALVASAGDPAVVAEELRRALELIRSSTWGAHAQVVLMLPNETVTGGSTLWLREAYGRVAAEMQGVTLIDTRGIASSSVSGCDVLTGAGILEAAGLMQYDFQGINSAQRMAKRRRGTGYRRFATEAAAQAFVVEMIAAGVTLREVSPVVGGPGQQAELGHQMPWPLVLTLRGTSDVVQQPVTSEWLVPIDRRAVKAGFTAPSGDGTRIAGDPPDLASEYPDDLGPPAIPLTLTLREDPLTDLTLREDALTALTTRV